MSRFFAYLYTQRRVVLLWAVTAALLWLLCSLYRLPFEPFGYAMALSGVAGGILLGAGYPAYARHCRDAELAADTPGACPAFAPPEGGPEGLEAAYQQSLRALADAYARTGRTAREQRDDMLDYFTMWAHQVKTPLAAMRLLLQGEEAPPRAELERELFATEGYVGMVLGYLRLGSPQNDLVLRPTPLDPVIRAGARRFARMFILKKADLLLRGHRRPPRLRRQVGGIRSGAAALQCSEVHPRRGPRHRGRRQPLPVGDGYRHRHPAGGPSPHL